MRAMPATRGAGSPRGITRTGRSRRPPVDLGLSDAELGLTAFRRVAERTLGAEGLPWYVSYRVRVAVR